MSEAGAAPRLTVRGALLLALLGAALASLAAPAASGAHTCSLSSGVLQIDLDSFEDITLVRSGSNLAISSDAGTTASCGATITNVATIDIDGPCGGTPNVHCGQGESVTLDLGGGPFEPGLGDEAGPLARAEIEFEINLGANLQCFLVPCPDEVIVLGGAGPDAIEISTGGAIGDSARGINLNGDNDRDVVIEEVERVSVAGRAGNDRLSGAGTSVFAPGGFPYDRRLELDGGAGDDAVHGGSADDVLTGGAGDDSVSGGAGSDRLAQAGVPDGSDALSGGEGSDTMDYALRSAAVRVTLDGVADDGAAGEDDDVQPDVEVIRGGLGPDHVAGSDGDETIDAGSGADHVEGGGGEDSITGGQHDDEIHPGPGEDDVNGGLDDDLIVADDLPDGADTLHGGPGVDEVSYAARSAAVRIFADGSRNDGAEAEGDHVMAEALRGGAGADVLGAGAGPHRLLGGAGRDTADYSDRMAPVRVTLDATPDDGADGEGDDVRTENVVGGAAGDRITGSVAANRLFGLAGDDRLSAGGGADVLAGGEGEDLEFGNSGPDRFDQSLNADGADGLNGGPGRDVVHYSARKVPIFASLDGIPDDGAEAENDNIGLDVEDVIGGAGADRLDGSARPNRLLGRSGADRILGRGADDVLRGQAGNDVLGGHAGDDLLAGGTGRDVCAGGTGRDRLRGCER